MTFDHLRMNPVDNHILCLSIRGSRGRTANKKYPSETSTPPPPIVKFSRSMHVFHLAPSTFNENRNELTLYYRCRAEGQIAAHSFQNPSFSDGHFVVFDEKKFGMVWLELTSFSIYVRVDEKELSD